MKHKHNTPKAPLVILVLVATVLTLAAPVGAQVDFPWATQVEFIGPTTEDITTYVDAWHVKYRSLLELDNCPQWVKDLYDKDGDMSKCINMFKFMEQYKRHPFFTPDGKWIVFDDLYFGAWMVPVEGGEPRLACDWYFNFIYNDGQITGGDGGIWQICGLSPDGKEVVGVRKLFCEEGPIDSTFTVTHPDGTTHESGMLLTRATTIASRNIDTGVERVMSANAILGRWSHDGRWFVYVKRDPDLWTHSFGTMDNYYSWEAMITGLYVKDTSTDQSWQIASLATCPCFSPDDTSVICSMKDTNGIWQIFSIPREGGVPQQLTFHGPNDNGKNARVSDVSPDGKWILYMGEFSTDGETQTGLCVLNTVSCESYPLFPDASCLTTDGSWSPDGRKIAFAVSYPWILNNGVRNGDKYAIYTVDFEPGNFEKLTAVNEKPLAGFAITGNYPNPFNPATTISFTLPEAGKATLTVYDITGRKVREIVNGQLAGGMHTVVWNGCDTFGRSVSSGVYFSRLTMNGITTANRMLLAK